MSAVSQTYQIGDALTGKEEWVVAGRAGETIWTHGWGEKKIGEWWWPIVHVALDAGMVKIDVHGLEEARWLSDCSEIRIGLGKIIQHENFYDQP